MSLPYNAVKRYYSIDTGAPSLAGQAGSLIGLLDAILINGYGTASINGITRSGSTVTVETAVAHGLQQGAVALIAGADQVDYNGQWIVDTVPDTTHFTFDAGVLTPVSPATGTMTVKRAPVGLTKAFAGTNKAAYQLPAGTSQALLRVDDSTTTYASITGYESMTDVDTGVNGLATGTSVWAKSSTADATARPWIAWCDDRFVWLLVKWHASAGMWSAYCWGDTVPFNPLDVYCTMLIADTAIGGSNPGSNGEAMRIGHNPTGYIPLTNTWSAPFSGHRMARSYNQIGTSINVGKTSLAAMLASMNTNGGKKFIGQDGMAYPSPVDNGFYVQPIYVVHDFAWRARLPGMLSHLHGLDGLEGTKLSNLDGLPSHTIELRRVNAVGSTTYTAAFDITGPWR